MEIPRHFPPRRPSRLVSVRLTAWYCGLFSLSLAVLFAFVYWTLNATLRKTDEESAPRQGQGIRR